MESLNYFYTGGAMFDIIPIIGTLIFIAVFVVIITSIVKDLCFQLPLYFPKHLHKLAKLKT